MAKGLGRGLDALFDPHGTNEELHNNIAARDISVALIDNNPMQPRKEFDENKLKELADSIEVHGVVEPLIVTSIGDGRYRIVAGERRFRAAKMAGLETVPVVIRSYADKDLLQIALIENIQREDLNPMEEAAALDMLLKDNNLTQEQLAKRLGKSRSAVTNSLRLLTLPRDIQVFVTEGSLSAGHARALLALTDPEDIHTAAKEIMEKQLSVRQTEDLVRAMQAAAEAEEKPTRGQRTLSPEFQAAQERMCRHLDAKVRITGNNKKGRITIEYASPEQLAHLFECLATDVPTI